MGRKYLVISRSLITEITTLFALICGSSTLAFSQEIHDPFQPHVIRPPNEGEDSEQVLEDDLQRLKKRRLDREHKQNPPTPRSVIKKLRLIEEAKKKPEQELHLQVNFVAPFISAKGDRESYLLDYSSSAEIFWRSDKTQKVSETQVWYGFRLAAFSGSGIYQNVPARFGFTYVGPMVGWGKINLSVANDEEKKKAGDWRGTLNYPSRFGYFFMLGVVGQSRSVKTYATEKEVSGEFESKGFSYDAPGLFVETTLFSLFYEAYSYNFIFGAQLGSGKVFSWVGMGMGTWL